MFVLSDNVSKFRTVNLGRTHHTNMCPPTTSGLFPEALKAYCEIGLDGLVQGGPALSVYILTRVHLHF